jgi:hypothetical protein
LPDRVGSENDRGANGENNDPGDGFQIRARQRDPGDHEAGGPAGERDEKRLATCE